MATVAMTTIAAWTRKEDKAFENAVAATVAPPANRPPDEGWFTALAHYEALVEDVAAIEVDRVPHPCYTGEEPSTVTPDSAGGASSAPKDGGGAGGGRHRREERKSGIDVGKSCSKVEQERRKGISWTEEEHSDGARNFVISQTPTQVASNAQKYFIRLNSMNRNRRRSSIHDITNVTTGEVAAAGAPITGGPAIARTMLMGPASMKHHHPSPPMSMYEHVPMGHPVAGHMVAGHGRRQDTSDW
ncbi:hypothetical protein SETIT_3G113700v2 [Setaria italica]|uniref:Uncharacterized protein n=1 Tax=Setaria italica TaxID=4555 RepID=A0A368QDW6_SETIT|nr:hypothetical protein SETIT_3G113700v2 [Setaria italica]